MVVRAIHGDNSPSEKSRFKTVSLLACRSPDAGRSSAAGQTNGLTAAAQLRMQFDTEALLGTDLFELQSGTSAAFASQLEITLGVQNLILPAEIGVTLGRLFGPIVSRPTEPDA